MKILLPNEPRCSPPGQPYRHPGEGTCRSGQHRNWPGRIKSPKASIRPTSRWSSACSRARSPKPSTRGARARGSVASHDHVASTAKARDITELGRRIRWASHRRGSPRSSTARSPRWTPSAGTLRPSAAPSMSSFAGEASAAGTPVAGAGQVRGAYSIESNGQSRSSHARTALWRTGSSAAQSARTQDWTDARRRPPTPPPGSG